MFARETVQRSSCDPATVAKLRIFTEKLILKGFKSCWNEITCEGARVTP